MRHTFEITSGSLDKRFIKSIRDIFGEKSLRIVVEDIDKENVVDQRILYTKTLPLIALFRDVKVDPILDLSSLANEVNS